MHFCIREHIIWRSIFCAFREGIRIKTYSKGRGKYSRYFEMHVETNFQIFRASSTYSRGFIRILGSLSITEIVARIYVRNVFRYPYKIFTSFLRVSRWRSSSHGDTYSNLLFIEFTFLLTVIFNVVKEFFFFASFSIL